MDQTNRVTWRSVWRHRGAGEAPVAPAGARQVTLVVVLMVGGGVLLDALVSNLWVRAATAFALVAIGYVWTRREQMRAALTTPIHARESRWLPGLVWVAYVFVYGWLGDAHLAAVFAAAAGSSLALANALQRRSVRRQLRAAAEPG